MGKEGLDEWVVRSLLERLTSLQSVEGEAVDLSEREVAGLCRAATQVLLKDASLLQLKPPLSVAGGVHGQYGDFLSAICAGGDYPPGIRSNWLFLGDYTGRGSRGLDVLCFVLALKVLFPEHVFLLRGASEDVDSAQLRGALKEEARTRLQSSRAWQHFVPVFEALPFAAVIGQPPHRIFAVHGGLSPMMRLSDIAALQRPAVLPRVGLATDLVWADLDPLLETYAVSYRGISHRFGRKAVRDFCARNNVTLIVRSHQVVQEGYQYCTPHLVTLWTAVKYNNELENMGAVLRIPEAGVLSFRVLVPEPPKTEEEEETAAVSDLQPKRLPRSEVRKRSVSSTPRSSSRASARRSAREASPSAHPLTPRAFFSVAAKAANRLLPTKNRPTPLPRRRSAEPDPDPDLVPSE